MLVANRKDAISQSVSLSAAYLKELEATAPVVFKWPIRPSFIQFNLDVSSCFLASLG